MSSYNPRNHNRGPMTPGYWLATRGMRARFELRQCEREMDDASFKALKRSLLPRTKATQGRAA